MRGCAYPGTTDTTSLAPTTPTATKSRPASSCLRSSVFSGRARSEYAPPLCTLSVRVPRPATSTTASMPSASLMILELRPEAERSCASRRLMFLGNSDLLPWLPPSGYRYFTKGRLLVNPSPLAVPEWRPLSLWVESPPPLPPRSQSCDLRSSSCSRSFRIYADAGKQGQCACPLPASSNEVQV